MCGIVVVLWEYRYEGNFTKGLEKLEYRGYDSAGIAVQEMHWVFRFLRKRVKSPIYVRVSMVQFSGSDGTI